MKAVDETRELAIIRNERKTSNSWCASPILVWDYPAAAEQIFNAFFTLRAHGMVWDFGSADLSGIHGAACGPLPILRAAQVFISSATQDEVHE